MSVFGSEMGPMRDVKETGGKTVHRDDSGPSKLSGSKNKTAFSAQIMR